MSAKTIPSEVRSGDEQKVLLWKSRCRIDSEKKMKESASQMGAGRQANETCMQDCQLWGGVSGDSGREGERQAEDAESKVSWNGAERSHRSAVGIAAGGCGTDVGRSADCASFPTLAVPPTPLIREAARVGGAL